MGIFSKCQIALDLDTSLSFKRKAALKRQIIDNDGVISYIVTRKVGTPDMHGWQMQLRSYVSMACEEMERYTSYTSYTSSS